MKSLSPWYHGNPFRDATAAGCHGVLVLAERAGDDVGAALQVADGHRRLDAVAGVAVGLAGSLPARTTCRHRSGSRPGSHRRTGCRRSRSRRRRCRASSRPSSSPRTGSSRRGTGVVRPDRARRRRGCRRRRCRPRRRRRRRARRAVSPRWATTARSACPASLSGPTVHVGLPKLIVAAPAAGAPPSAGTTPAPRTASPPPVMAATAATAARTCLPAVICAPLCQGSRPSVGDGWRVALPNP